MLDLLLAMLSDRGMQTLECERTLNSTNMMRARELCLGLQQWMKKSSFSRAEVNAVPATMAHIVRFQEQVSKRGGMGSLLVKNHLFFHLADCLCFWGPLSQMSFGPSESHHKTEVKAPSMNTQRRPSTFVQQTSKRHTEVRVVCKACQKLGTSEQQMMDRQPTPNLKIVPVTGARHSIGLNNCIPCMRWDSPSHKHRARILPAVTQVVCDVILPLMPVFEGKETCVPCFTEHKRSDGVDAIIWRAHPCHRSKETSPKDVWHDWACFQLEGRLITPCQILCLMDLSTMPARLNRAPIPRHRVCDIDEPAQCAVVRKFKAMATAVEHGALVDWGELDDGFCVLPLERICGPLCVVPNMPGSPWAESRGTKKKRDRNEQKREEQTGPPLGGYFVVRNQGEWEECFTEMVVFNNN